jgi:zinc protease
LTPIREEKGDRLLHLSRPRLQFCVQRPGRHRNSGWRLTPRWVSCAAYLPVLIAAILLESSCAAQAHVTHGPRQSPGSGLVRRMTFPPLQITIPRVPCEADRRVLPNGVILYPVEEHSLPTLDVYAVLRAGSQYQAAGWLGSAQFTAPQLRSGGTARHTAEANSLRLSGLARDTDDALRLLAEAIRRPVFKDEQLRVYKGHVIEDLHRVTDKPSQLLVSEFTRTFYTEAHPLGRPLTPDQVEAIQGEHLRDHSRRFFHPNNMMLAVVCDFRREEMAVRIWPFFGAWPSSPLGLPALPEVQPRCEPGVYNIPQHPAPASLTLAHFGINRFNPAGMASS